MTTAPTVSLPIDERFASFIRALCALIFSTHPAFLAGPLMSVIHNRVSRCGREFASLAARVRAGTLRTASAARRRVASATDDQASPKRRRLVMRGFEKWPVPPYRMPSRFGWLLPMLQYRHVTASFGGGLSLLLTDPEMAALVRASPGIQRLVRSLCRMLAVRLPPDLFPPRPRRRAPAAAAAAADPQATPADCSPACEPPSSGNPKQRQAAPARSRKIRLPEKSYLPIGRRPTPW